MGAEPFRGILSKHQPWKRQRDRKCEHYVMYATIISIMRKTNVKIIKKNIALLKEQKRKCFNIETGNVDFNVVQETCREMDILLLPLYFAWEHLCKQNLSDVQFELHLKRSYSKFSLDPERTTLIILLLLFPVVSKNLSDNTRKELLFIYQAVVNCSVEKLAKDRKQE